MEMNNTTKKDTFVFTKNGFEATDDEGQTVKLENGKFSFINSDGSKEEFKKKNHIIKGIIYSVTFMLTLIAFLVWGLCFNGWSICWILFIAVPALTSIVEVVEKKQISAFAFPLLVATVYLLLGMLFGAWHPYWFLFLFIPVFYMITEPIDKYVLKTKPVDNEEDED